MVRRNSKPMASAQAMSRLRPECVCHPGMSLQARHQSPMTIAMPMPELASENACGFRKRERGSVMGRDALFVDSIRFHQFKSSAIVLSGRCGRNGLCAHTANMRSKPVRYALPSGISDEVCRSLPYSLLTSPRQCL